MIDLIDILGKFTDVNRNNNNTARCSWHEQRQQIYVLYDNNYTKSDKQMASKSAMNTHSGNNS